MLIDSHCHLFDSRYGKDITELVDEAKEEGVVKLINMGTHLSESKGNLHKINEFPGVYTTIGIFPHEEKDRKLDEIISDLEQLLTTHKNIVALGECGIDLGSWQNERSESDQINLFEAQIELALKNKLPVVIHNRNGDQQILEILPKYLRRGLTGVVHGTPSTRTWETAKKFLDLGLYISFAGNITYPNTPHLIEIAQKVPQDRFLVETDAPYLPPQGHRGEVCYPKYAKIVANRISQIRNQDFEEICALSYENTCRLFHL